MRRRASAKKKKQKNADDSDEYGDDQVIIQPKPPCFISLEDEPHEETEVSTAANKVRRINRISKFEPLPGQIN
jgi:hypothetical protein